MDYWLPKYTPRARYSYSKWDASFGGSIEAGFRYMMAVVEIRQVYKRKGEVNSQYAAVGEIDLGLLVRDQI
jgi:hypothetical protein